MTFNNELATQSSRKTDRRHSKQKLQLLFQRIISAILFGLVLFSVLDYPVIEYSLLAGLIAYIAVTIRLPHAWLFLLPTILPLLNLAPWSGRLLFDEFDFFILATISIALWRGAYSGGLTFKHISFTNLFILLLTLSYLISLFIGLPHLAPLDANDTTTHYGQYNSLRIGKGFFSALLLLPLLRRELSLNRESARNYIIWGTVSGLLGLGIIILWERGVINDVIHAKTIYQALNSLLDFSTTYRVTGLFSDMHTGGEAIDGYIILAWPFALGAVLYYRNHWYSILLGAIALAAAIYTIGVTFTRGTYLASGVALLIFSIALLLSRPRHITLIHLGILTAILFTSITGYYFAYIKGGILALIWCFLIFATGILISRWPHRLSIPKILITVAVLATIFINGLYKAFITSKWGGLGGIDAFLVSIFLCLILLGASALLGHKSKKLLTVRTLVVYLILIMGSALITIPAISGHRMETRFSQAPQDVEKRLQHWKNVINAMESSWQTKLFGMGLGSFPGSYLFKFPSKVRDVGTYTYQQEYKNTFLRIGSGNDLKVGQRIIVTPNSEYKLTLDLRSNTRLAKLYIKLCHRNILFASSYIPICSNPYIITAKTNGQWQHAEIAIDSRKVGSANWYEFWPTTITFSNFENGAVTDIDNISLLDTKGQDLIKNGDFEQGGDRWFSYNDFEHLPWHIKNLLLNIYFEQGIIGIAAFSLLLIFGCIQAFNNAISGDIFALTLLTSITGFLMVGVTGSPFDAPRIVFFFYMTLFGTLHLSAKPETEQPNGAIG